MKTISIVLLLLFSITISYSQNNIDNKRCIPFLIDNQGCEKNYIYDSCIEDTLKIQFRVKVCFEDSLIDTKKPIIVKSVNLIDMYIRSMNSSRIITSLSKLKQIDSPIQQYIWDLCSAKVSYWYKFQPYEQLPQGEKIRNGNTIYMTSVIYLVGCPATNP